MRNCTVTVSWPCRHGYPVSLLTCRRSLTPARHVAETLQRHQKDSEAAAGRSDEAAGAAAPIDSAHQEDRGDDDEAAGKDGQPGSAALGVPDGAVEESVQDRDAEGASPEQEATAGVPSGLPRIRTAAASATSAILGVARRVGAIAPAKQDGHSAEASRDADGADGMAHDDGEQHSLSDCSACSFAYPIHSSSNCAGLCILFSIPLSSLLVARAMYGLCEAQIWYHKAVNCAY